MSDAVTHKTWPTVDVLDHLLVDLLAQSWTRFTFAERYLMMVEVCVVIQAYRDPQKRAWWTNQFLRRLLAEFPQTKTDAPALRRTIEHMIVSVEQGWLEWKRMHATVLKTDFEEKA